VNKFEVTVRLGLHHDVSGLPGGLAEVEVVFSGVVLAVLGDVHEEVHLVFSSHLRPLVELVLKDTFLVQVSEGPIEGLGTIKGFESSVDFGDGEQ